MRESRVDQVLAASVLHLNFPGGDGERVFRLLGTRKHVGRTAKNRRPGGPHRKRGIEPPRQYRRARPHYPVSMIRIGHSSLPQKSVPPNGGRHTTPPWCLVLGERCLKRWSRPRCSRRSAPIPIAGAELRSRVRRLEWLSGPRPRTPPP